ncbi:AN1-type zinc finger protein 1-like [Styela clava]
MAELNIGKQCSLLQCQRLDFLPFECDGCSQIFCLDHKGRTAHSCSDVNYIKEGSSLTRVTPLRSYSCSLEECNQSDLVQVECNLCGKHFCLKHRLPEDHKCHQLKSEPHRKAGMQTFQTSSTNPKKSVCDNSKKKSVSKKNQKLSAKVALMKLKQKSVGDKNIPMEKRIYFHVYTPKGERYIFVDGEWTFGKLIDYLCKTEKIINTNNVSLENRFGLLNMDTEQSLPFSSTINDAISHEIIYSGSSLKFLSVEKSS